MSALDPDPGPWLTTAEAARLMPGISERAVSNLCAAGEIEHVELKSKTGLRIRYRLSPRGIQRYISRHTVTTRRGAA